MWYCGHRQGMHITARSAMVTEPGAQWGSGAKARQHKGTPTQQENYGHQSKPRAGSFAHFPVISSFSFVSIMKNISHNFSFLLHFFLLTTLQNSTSDWVSLCCQWYNENPLALWGSWRIPLDQLEFLKLHFFLPVCEDNIINCKEMKGMRTEINSRNSAGVVFI